MLIDMHHHYIPRAFLDRVRQDPERWQGVVFRDEQSGLDAFVAGRTEPPRWAGPGRFPGVLDPGIFDLDVRLEAMAAIGIDMAALSPAPGLYYYFAELPIAAEVAALVNDEIHAAAKAHPDRFVPMAGVPMQDVAAAVAELERVVSQYGFTAVEIGGSVAGRHYDEPEFDDFFRRAAELDVLIFVHPATSPGPERLLRYYTANSIGFPVETSVCAASLIFGGLLERYPNLKVCLAHGGGAVPSLLGRWDHTWEVRDEARVHIDRPPSEYASRFYFDDLVHSDRVFGALVDLVGADHVVVGTDYPYDMGERAPLEALARRLPSAEERRLVESENAARLLRIEGRG